MTSIAVSISKDKIVSFLWQHTLLIISLYIMTLGVVLCIKSALGSSVISSLPLAFSIAGSHGRVPALSVGGYTIVMTFILVGAQIAVLRRRFEPVQLFQLVIGFLFGWLIDLNILLTDALVCDTLTSQIVTQFAGCTVMGFGIAYEVKCGSVTMPGEGFPVAISRISGIPFPKVKIAVDITLVVLAVASCYVFFGRWQWNIIGSGTLFAMVYVGIVVKLAGAHSRWFDRLLDYRPGFRRYLFGLARYLYKSNK